MSDSFEKVGRNDPCPCGSGKKYKKCHYQQDVIKRQASHSQADISDFLKPTDPAYLWYKGLRVIVNRRDWVLLYEAFTDDSPLREKYPDAEAFVAEARASSSNAPAGGDDFELRRFRFLDEHVFVMGVRGKEERHSDSLEYEVLVCRQVDGEGLRIFDVNRQSVPRGENEEDPAFETFPAAKAIVDAALARPFVRPEVKRWPIPGEEAGDQASAAPAEASEEAETAAE